MNLSPLPKRRFFLIIGRVSRLLQGLTVTPTVVDTDYHGEIKILVTSTQEPLTLRAGEHIAQALPLPLFGHFPYMKEERGPSSLGSSEVYWAQKITDSRPMLTLFLEGKQFQGLLDTGAEATVISLTHWPAAFSPELVSRQQEFTRTTGFFCGKLYCFLRREDPDPGKWCCLYSPQHGVSAPDVACQLLICCSPITSLLCPKMGSD